MSDDLKTLVAQEVAKQLAAIAADQTTKKVLEFLKNRNSALAYVVDKGESGEIGWRVWSDGLTEQWLNSSSGNFKENTLNKTFTFVKPYSNTRYALVGVGAQIGYVAAQDVSKATTGFSTSSVVVEREFGTGGWYAIGY